MPTLRCFGGVSLIGPDEREVSFRSRKHLALLLFLASRQGQPVNRASLAFFLWDTEESLARHSLSQALYDLRSKVPELELRTTAGSLRLEPGHVEYEGRWFDEAIREEDLARAVHLYRGDFGTNLEGIGPEPFERWLESQRDRFRSLAQISFRRFVSECDLRGQWGDVCLTAMRLVKLNPIDESAHSTLMRALWLHGDQQSALEHYADHEAFFHRELPGGPSRELLDLVERIRSSRPPAASGRGFEDAELPLVGREEEFEVLRRIVRDLPQGGGVASVSGEAGIGKTRLLEEVGRLAPVEGLTLLTSRCYSAESDVAYGPILDAVEPLARRLVESDGLERRYYQLGHLFPDLFRLEPAVAEAETVEPGVRRRRMFEEVADLIRAACASAPVLWILEDLQWMDRSSASLLHYLGRRLEDEPFALILSVRSEAELTEAAERLIAAGPGGLVGERVELGPLSSDALGELVRHAASRSVDDGTLKSVRRYAGGNPFYALEILRAASERQDDRPEPGRVPNISTRLRDVLATRLEGLEPKAVRILEAIAVLGRHAVADHVANVAGLSLARAAEVAIDLTDRRIVRETPDRYEFAHDITREFVYGNLGLLRRAALHLAAAEVLAKDHSVSPATMARHFARGADRARAYEYAMRAAEASTASFAHAEAAAMGDLAAQVANSSEQKLVAFEIATKGFFAAGRLIDSLERGNRLLGQIEGCDFLREAQTRLLLAKILVETGAWNRALQMVAEIPQLTATAEASSATELALQALTLQVKGAIWKADKDSASHKLERLKKISQRAREQETLTTSGEAEVLYSEAAFSVNYSLPGEVETHLGRLSELDSHLSPDLQHRSLLLRAYYLMRSTRFSEAEAVMKRGLAVAREYNDFLNVASYLNNLAAIRLENGALQEAGDLALESQELLRTIPSPASAMLPALVNIANASFYGGHPRAALEEYKRALSASEGSSTPVFTYEIRASLGLVCLQLGSVGEAREHWDQLASILPTTSLGVPERHKIEWLRAALNLGSGASHDILQKAAAEEQALNKLDYLKLAWLNLLLARNQIPQPQQNRKQLKGKLRTARLLWFERFSSRWLRAMRSRR